MPIPAKITTKNSGGGVSFMGERTVLMNGRPASRIGDLVTAHKGPHPPNPIVQGSKTVIIGKRPQGFLGSRDACGHVMMPVEPNILVGL